MTETLECGICSEKATSFCPSCFENFCSKCNAFFHQQTKNSHMVLSLSEKSGFRPSQKIKCSRHKLFVKQYCMWCQVSCCDACHLLHHTHHYLIDVDHYSMRKIRELKGYKEYLETQIKDLESNKNALIQNWENLDQVVKEIIENDLKQKAELLKTNILETKIALEKLKAINVQNIDENNLSTIVEYKKVRFEKTCIEKFFSDIKNIEPNLSLETKSNEFMSCFLETYYNRMKDPVYLESSYEKLSKESPMSLLTLLIKAEIQKISKEKDEKFKATETYKRMISQIPYDSYDEFAISEAHAGLNKKEESFNFLKQAAYHGNMLAKHKLGTIYFNGDIGLGITQNKTEGIKWFRASCEVGCPLSQYSLGYCYYLGDGVPKDRNEAAHYYLISAKQGYTIAEHKLANCLENGIGMDENLEEARTYYEKAASKGYEPALQALALLVEKILERKQETIFQGDFPEAGPRKLSYSVESTNL